MLSCTAWASVGMLPELSRAQMMSAGCFLVSASCVTAAHAASAGGIAASTGPVPGPMGRRASSGPARSGPGATSSSRTTRSRSRRTRIALLRRPAYAFVGSACRSCTCADQNEHSAPERRKIARLDSLAESSLGKSVRERADGAEQKECAVPELRQCVMAAAPCRKGRSLLVGFGHRDRSARHGLSSSCGARARCRAAPFAGRALAG